MAEAATASATPTFKLVLVGDGGTGKVCQVLIFIYNIMLGLVSFITPFVGLWYRQPPRDRTVTA